MPQVKGPGTAAAAVAVLVLAVAASAVAAPWRLAPRSWFSSGGDQPSLPPITPRLPNGLPSGPPRAGPAHPVDLGWLAPVGVVAGAVAVAALLWWLWRRYQQSAVERATSRELGDVMVLPDTPELPVLRQGVAAAQRYLEEIADPNNAIVAAWLALESAASTSGVTRKPAETPTEFTMDILGATAADPQATRELLTLYHRARFSATGVSRADVSAASSCLAVLARSWEAMSADAVSAAVALGSGEPDR